MFKSKYCILVFIVSLFVGYMIAKTSFRNFFVGSYFALINIIVFLLLFSLSLTCNIRLLRIKIKEYRKSLYTPGIINAILYIFGIIATQTCLINGVCGISIGLSLLSTILPSIVLKFFVDWGVWILLMVNLALLINLFYMKCFRNKSVEPLKLIHDNKKLYLF